MIKITKILAVVALTAVLVIALTGNVGCDSCGASDSNNGAVPNGDTPNGDVPNGDASDGYATGNNPDDLDLSGPGVIIEYEEFDGQTFQAGDPAPDFLFQDANGQSFALSDFKGKAVFLNFWRTTCGYCIIEMPYIQQAYEKWQDGELVILTIDIGESAEKVTEFLQARGITVPVLLDTDGAVMMQYRVSAIPRSFFIDKEGAIRGIMPGAFSSPEQLEDALNQLVSL
jgi:peroxiredoxin